MAGLIPKRVTPVPKAVLLAEKRGTGAGKDDLCKGAGEGWYDGTGKDSWGKGAGNSWCKGTGKDGWCKGTGKDGWCKGMGKDDWCKGMGKDAWCKRMGKDGWYKGTGKVGTGMGKFYRSLLVTKAAPYHRSEGDPEAPAPKCAKTE